MPDWKLGAFASVDAGLGLQIETVSHLDVSTIHLHAPRKPGRTAERAAELSETLAGIGVEITCLFAGFEGESYADIPTVQRTVGLVPRTTRSERVAEFREIIDFATMLQVGPVGLHLGFVPHDRTTSDYAELLEVARSLCDYAADEGHAIHLETGQEPAHVLLAFLEDVERQNLFINFDPANMVLYGCGEPIEALQIVGKYVRSVHCKDAIGSDQPGITWGQEVPVGDGDVDFVRFLQVLADLEYSGPLTVEREIPSEPERQIEEIGLATSRLREMIATITAAG